MTTFIRFRYYEYPTEWKAVTRERTFEDGTKSFNELSDAAPKKWELVYQFDLRTPGKADELLVFDLHYEDRRNSRPFDFLAKQYGLLENVYYADYDRFHDAHKFWIQTRRITLIKYDFTPPTSLTAPSVPRKVSGVPHSTSPDTAIRVSWEASVVFTGRTIAAYRVKVNGVLIPDVVGATSVVVGSLAPGTIYSFSVAARDSTGEESAFSAPINVSTYATANFTPPAPTAPVTDDVADSFNWTNATDYSAVTDYEYTINGGASFAAATSKPIGVGNAAYAIGQVGVRVKAATGRNTSATLFNTVAFTVSGGSTAEGKLFYQDSSSLLVYDDTVNKISYKG